MNQEYLQKLSEAGNVEELHRAIEELCQPFGKPSKISIVRDERRNGYMCFLNFDSPNLDSSIVENFGGFYFGKGVAFSFAWQQAND